MGRDLESQPPADGRAARRAYFEARDGGDYRDGIRAGWGIETRDPTGDRRVVEFCLAIPEGQFLRGGEIKSLYRRAFEGVFPAAEIATRKRGLQAADWHEGLTAARAQVAAELDRLERSAGARRALDLPRLRRLVENWPTGNWHREDVTQQYRQMLMRGVAAGMFIRALEGGNE
jgi:asparagine synthase (glutamine-hydrolysing)